jgi:catechol 2,3-dioxygenase-like lactoylglutathione lyase family enzyme
MSTPRVIGVLETAIYVADLERSQGFYERVLGCVEIMREAGRLHALRIPGDQVLLIFARGRSVVPSETPGGRIPAHDGSGQLHLAFEVAATDVDAWRRNLQELGVQIESEVACPRGGHSLYFRDPDNHLVELVTRDCWGFT